VTALDERQTVKFVQHTTHAAGRPGWYCIACFAPWPCPSARGELAEEFRDDPIAGSIYLAGCMYAAIEDSIHSGEPAPNRLWHRFLGWYVALRLKHSAASDASVTSGTAHQKAPAP
jgi:hypothetical protein